MKKALLAGLVGLMMGGGMLVPQLAHAAGAPPLAPANCPAGVTPIVSGTQAAVCVGGLPTSAVGFNGGAVEAGVTTTNGPTRLCVAGTPVSTAANPVGAYVIADGDDANTLNNSSGYIGVSNYESGTNSTCPTLQDPTTPNDGSGTNSGGYVGVKGVLFLPVPFVACGFTSGPNFGTAGRDGCGVP
jgi:hypothetical protein